ncbi:MAG: GNAT family protein [Polyangiales bacterium]
MPIAHVPIQRGPRTTLRPIEARDELAFLAAAHESTALHADWVAAPRDAAAFSAYVGRRGDTFLPLGLFDTTSHQILGVFNLSQIFMGPFCSAYLGYYAFAPHHGRGYMREGMTLLLRLAFGHVGLHRVEANIQPENTASIALVQRTGFQREGYSPGYLFIAGAWRDHERWAMRRELMGSVEQTASARHDP